MFNSTTGARSRSSSRAPEAGNRSDFSETKTKNKVPLQCLHMKPKLMVVSPGEKAIQAIKT